MRKILMILAVTAGLLLGALPAQAGSMTWTDKAGDATPTAPIPNEETLDLVSTTIHTDANKLRWTANVKKASTGSPSASVGHFFVFEFEFGGKLWDLRVKDDVAGKSATFRQVATGAQDLPCKDCAFKFEREKSQVTVEAPLASLAAAIKGADKAAPPFGKGSVITKLLVNSYRSYAAIYYRTDDAPAPAEAEYKV